jgi:tetratricopeptide (TPR) repeat protein
MEDPAVRYVCVLTLAALLVTVSPAAAGQIGVVRGEVTCEHCSSYSGLVIDITDSSRQPVNSSAVGTNGSFEIQNVREGAYQVTVKNFRGDVLHQDVIHINRHSQVQIIIPEQEKVERPVSGTISYSRLKHKVPKEAKKEYEDADKKLKKGDVKASLQHLLKAVEIDPNYMEAHNNLGSRYMMLNEYELSLSAFRRALELDPSASMVQLNMAVALMALNQAKEAEQVARRVLQRDPANMKGNYVLGLALYSQREYTNETVALLTNVQDQFPNARLAVAAIHAMRGEPMKAKTELESYMASPSATNREQAKSMLAQLQQQGN